MSTLKRQKNNSGYVTLALTFLIAIAVPLFYIGVYYDISNQNKVVSRDKQDKILKWSTRAMLARTQYEFQKQVAEFSLEDSRFNLGLVEEINTPVFNWFDQGAPFKANYAAFIQGTELSDFAVKNVTPVPGCLDCGVTVNDIDRLLGTAEINITIQTQLEDVNLIDATRRMTQHLSLAVSNLADFAIFTNKDFVTNPGPDTVYDGPIYVGENAYLTPSKDHKITLRFDGTDAYDDGKVYNLKASGHLSWFGPRGLGCDPKDNNCVSDENQLFESGLYEVDVFGKPVMYHFISNIDYGDVGESTLEAMDNSPENFDSDLNNDQYIKLLGSSPLRPPVSFFTGRDQSDGMWPSTTVHTLTADLNSGGAVFNSSTAYDGTNPVNYYENPDWDGFRATHFDRLNGFSLIKDGAPAQQLLLGGVDDPHVLIESAGSGDNGFVKSVKLQWLGREPQPNISGLSIDFKQLFCQQPDLIGSSFPHNCTVGENYEDPLLWEGRYFYYDSGTFGSANNENGFIRILKPPFSLYWSFLMPSEDSATYIDNRRKPSTGTTALAIIEIDVAKLKNLIENGLVTEGALGPNGDTYEKYNDLGLANRFGDPDKPFILYIGLTPPLNTTNRDPWWTPLNGHGATHTFDPFRAVVRLVHADQLPDAGLTIATNGPVQIVGDYNTEAPQEGTPPEACTMKPAAVMADQIMVLSNSWQDYTGTPDDPYIDPSDGIQYPAPRDDLNNLFSKDDYRAHPVRSQCTEQEEENGSCFDDTAEINAMLIGGDIPNQLVAVTASEIEGGNLDRYGLFYDGNLTGVNGDEKLRPHNNPSASDDQHTYVKGTQVRDQNQIDDTAYLNIPVILITGYDANDNPIYSNAGTVGQVFGTANNDGKCADCWRDGVTIPDIPMYLTMDRDGTYTYLNTGNMNTSHLKPSDMIQTDPTSNTAKWAVKPGSRFAAIVNDGKNSNERFLFPNTAAKCCKLNSPEGCCDVAQQGCNGPPCDACPGQNYVVCNDCSGFNNGQNICNTDPNGQGKCSNNMECWDCPYYQCGGEGGCSTETYCGPEADTVCWSDTCPAELGCGRDAYQCGTAGEFPPEIKVVYSPGGKPRFTYRQNGQNPQNGTIKRKGLYVPHWEPKYSGGIENYVRLGEDWRHWDCNCTGNSCSSCTPTTTNNEMKITGTLDILWPSQSLVKGNGPDAPKAFWVSTTYTAPDRTVRYARDLRENEVCPPAGLPMSVQLTLKGFKQE
ncbi:MAG: hypothetical protein COV74_08425 [Candidatus Omnitrophica bacterium CG11_big_fil_rev_8_21_14_0_20_45_26]|uniref:Uncharacterized protein n=1 Tax=Candidatus Abzuiibacterium crystallinum TaxID=1974748 RepID=A0A2H0LME8_9BACT|nr:MAG: hypothetical protein COV74_08425 [Candidatus Omnitrophica bacterium CG11_big_fil_rev_8_21_14_0_20_45_26]PIW63686.1 MAG: hypothetical protein COW12_09310 [Candidatus Omnitrophica bacterium CG12_big_fil_rev_8_21_14_0_65_45_16]